MKIIVRFFILFIFIICHITGNAQERLVISNITSEGRNCMGLKFYDEKVFYPEGVNIYRISEDGQRLKITDKPFKKGDYPIPPEKLAADSSLQEYKEVADHVKPAEVKSFLSLFLIMKTLEDADYAKYVGIMYEDCNVELGKSYSYEVFEIINGEEKHIESSPFTKVETFLPLKAPDSLSVVATDEKVFLNWEPNLKAFWAINIYRKRGDESVFSLLNEQPIMMSEIPKEDGTYGYPEEFYIDEPLQNGIAYTYKIEGIDYFSRPTQTTEEVTVTPRDRTPPVSPGNVRAEVGLLDITLTWQNHFKSKDMAGYHVYRQQGRHEEPVRINEILLPQTQEIFFDTLQEPGTYIYHVASVDSSGNEGLSYPAIGEIMDIFPPKTPTGFQVVADTGRIILSWDENKEKDLMGYRVYRTVGDNRDGSYVLLNADPVRDTEFIDSLPKNAKNYFFYKLTAVDSSYNMSEYTNPLSSRMPDIIPPRQPFITNVTPDEKSIKIQWLANSESDLMGYDIYRYETNDSLNTLKRLNLSLLNADAKLFTDYWAENNIAYHYYLTAVDSNGNVSDPSVAYDGILVMAVECKLDVRKLKASVKKSGKVNLSWKMENENDENYLGCIVYKKDTESNTYKAITSLMETEKYTGKLGKDESSWFQIRAYDNAGCIVKSEEILVVGRK